MSDKIRRIYEKLILSKPWITLLLVFSLIIFFAVHIPNFRLDASSDSLLLENDESIKYYREIKKRYGSDEYLLVTYTPQNYLFSDPVITDLKNLRDEFAKLEKVESVISILDVPLVSSQNISLKEFQKHIPTLLDTEIDRETAKNEFLTSPIYKDVLLSSDTKTTALLINFYRDDKWFELLNERNRLRDEDLDYSEVEKEFNIHNSVMLAEQELAIEQVREVIVKHGATAKIYLGGVPMITADSIEYVRSDLQNFGVIILAFIILLLTIILRSARWVFLPMLVCFSVGITMFGFLGFMGWPVTVVSSNFISLLLIFTLSFSVHQIVRYREYQSENRNASAQELVKHSTLKIITPCFYMVVTTIVAFGSLVVSDIRPVIDFGWMMAIGLAFAFLTAFTIFPAILMLLPKPKPRRDIDLTQRITSFFARYIQKNRHPILFLFVVMVATSIWGLQYLTVENRFIDYFKESTEIHQGMKIIDQKLGGTTPLDVVIDAPKDFLEFQEEEEDFYEYDDSPTISKGYWFNGLMLEDIAGIHNYLDNLPETGKVLSFHSAIEMLSSLDEESEIDSFYMSVLYKKLPEDVKQTLFDPYISDDGNQLRFSIRVFESDRLLNRQQLISKIQNDLTEKLNLEPEQVKITGMLRLYNNVLQSLFSSQIKTIWVVFITIFVMFSILFRSLYVAAVAFLPNVTITALVLGIMGWLHIPLDIMTITIAAICTGTADDNTIHYVHRMMNEYKKHGNYWQAVRASHTTIGRAMYYTSITIMLGFSILGFSNFVPTIYFGLLTAFAMAMALFANLALLPLLIVTFKPFGKEAKSS